MQGQPDVAAIGTLETALQLEGLPALKRRQICQMTSLAILGVHPGPPSGAALLLECAPPNFEPGLVYQGKQRIRAGHPRHGRRLLYEGMQNAEEPGGFGG